MAQDSIMGEKIAYGTTYKELVELFPLTKTGESYAPGSMFAIEDPEHVELDGEGNASWFKPTNNSFTRKHSNNEAYHRKMESLQCGNEEAPKSELETQPVQ